MHSNESACRKSGRLGLEQVIIVHFSIVTNNPDFDSKHYSLSNMLRLTNYMKVVKHYHISVYWILKSKYEMELETN